MGSTQYWEGHFIAGGTQYWGGNCVKRGKLWEAHSIGRGTVL